MRRPSMRACLQTNMGETPAAAPEGSEVPIATPSSTPVGSLSAGSLSNDAGRRAGVTLELVAFPARSVTEAPLRVKRKKPDSDNDLILIMRAEMESRSTGGSALAFRRDNVYG